MKGARFVRLRRVPFSPSTLSVLAVAALLVAGIALMVSIGAWRRSGRRTGAFQAPPRSPRSRAKAAPVAADQVAAELHDLRSAVATSLRHLAVVRYDAFGDMGGHLSWSLALLDDGGDGVVVTSIHGRSDSRTYAKNIAGWTASSALSPEEEEAIGFARTGST
jgi:Protein of unknown function (DUF4446)